MQGRDEIVRSVMELPERERAEIARDILETLDDEEVNEDVEQAWAQEVARRIRDLDEKTASTVPASEAFARAQSRLTQRP